MDFNGQSRAPIYLLFLGGMALFFFAVGMLFPTEPREVYSEEVYDPARADEEIEDIVKEGYHAEVTQVEEIDSSPNTAIAQDKPVEKEIAIERPVEQKNEPNLITKGGEYFDKLWIDYQENVIDKLPTGKSRTDVVIRYYKHPKDGNKISAIKPLRFYIHERPIDSVMLPFESNAVFYGDSITTQDLQLTVYKLINAGFPIKKVSLSEYHDNWKAHAIEIGSDTTIMQRAVLSVAEVSSL